MFFNSVDSNLLEANNCNNCFNIIDSEDCKYVYNGDGGQKKCYDLNYTAEIEKSYEGAMVAGYKNLFCFMVVHGKNNLYCDLCMDCENCFACVGLRNKKYCIFNKQFTKEEYNKLIPKIIDHMRETGEWGEYFSSKIGPFGYNETVAMEYFSLTKNEALNTGFKWSDYEAPFPKVEKIIQANKLPDNINNIPDDILNLAIECEITKKPFKITRQELDFYRKHNLGVPKRHPDMRHLERLKLRNPRKLYDRKCDKCGKNMKTTYSADVKDIIYCEECYNKYIY